MFRELLKQRIPKLTPEQLARMAAHYELLVRWNRSMNLTRITREIEVVEQHYCESLFLAGVLPIGVRCVVDVGSGAGFPGVPVAAVRREVSVTLVESHHRKAAFLRESTREWGNVRVLAARIEDVDEQFEWAVCRAVRWSEVDPVVARICGRAAVLTGEKSPEGRCFVWDAGVEAPWGKGRFLYLGRNVSRETV